ncbi:MAG: hypothetical protein QXE81_06540 [Desulfurococcaceae archaeon]
MSLNAPRLIITCRGTSIDLCEHEIGNVLFPRDPDVKIERTSYQSVLLVYTHLDVDKAYAFCAHREYGFVENIIPIHCTLTYPFEEEGLSKCLSSLNIPKNIKLRVRARGIRGVSSSIYHLAIEKLRSIGISHNSSSKTCLYIELINTTIYVGAGSCHSVFKAIISR